MSGPAKPNWRWPIEADLDAGRLPDIKALQARFQPDAHAPPRVTVDLAAAQRPTTNLPIVVSKVAA